MSIFDKLTIRGLQKPTNLNTVNDKPSNRELHSYQLFYRRFGQHSDIYLWSIFNTIFRGLDNVQFTAPESNKALVSFLTRNIHYLVWQLWSYGYIVIGIDERNNYYVPDYTTLIKDGDGRIVNHKCVYYSNTYRFENRNDFEIIRPILDSIGIYRDAELNLTSNYGAIGIMTGKSLPVNPAQKDEFISEFKSKMGNNSDKTNLLVTSMPLDFSVMDFKVKDLELTEKVKIAYTSLCNYFGVPVDMIFGQSTYSNQEQAIKNFYSGCIAPLAEAVLACGRYIIRLDTRNLTPTDDLSFRIDNVDGLTDDRIIDNTYVKETLENIKLMQEIGLDTKHLEAEIQKYINSL